MKHHSPKPTGYRTVRLELLIREEINALLDGEINDPRLEHVRITRAELSRDGSRARLWFVCTADAAPDELRLATHALQRASGFLRGRLGDALPLKRLPELRFCHDPAADEGDA